MPVRSLKIFTYIFLLFIFSELSSSESPDSTQLASENIYIHVDRSSYIAGENIFFKLYLLNESTHKLSHLSKIA